MEIHVNSNKDDVISELYDKLETALEDCGLDAEGYAIIDCPVDTGALRQSISHVAEVYSTFARMTVGSSMEYATYVELGTGVYAAGGRQTPWVYYDEGKDKFFMTKGMPARPFIKPAIADHKGDYADLIREHLQH